MDASTLIKQLLAQREAWLELEPAAGDAPAKAVLLRRPGEAELHRFAPVAGTNVQDRLRSVVNECAVGWRGFRDCDIQGEGVGGTDPVPFASELWAAVVIDRIDWVSACAGALMDRVSARLQQRSSIAKN